MKIAIASGKGGTGKTTVATSLALALTTAGGSISFLDCDVEAPDAHIFLHPEYNEQRDVNLLIPEVDMSRCTGCGRCAEVCQYHAIVHLGGRTLVFPELCHGCGSCTLECPERAISEVPDRIGLLEAGNATNGLSFAQGLLDIGKPFAVPVIRELKRWHASEPSTLSIWDAPPGTSCPVVESVRGADYVILVSEPTPFGLHDLKLAVQLTTELGIPCGVIINRDGIGDSRVSEFCEATGLQILMRIPLEREIAAGLATGKTLVEIQPGYRQEFIELSMQIESAIRLGLRS